MGSKGKILIGVLVLAVLVVVGAVLYDSSTDHKIAEGVTVGGVDVGGLDEDAAHFQVRANLVEPLQKTVIVKRGGEEFKLTRHESNVDADVERMVAEAMDASHQGSLPARVWRKLSGGEVDVAIEPEIKYDRDAVDHFVEHIGKRLNRDPVDASVEPSGGKLVPVESQPGFNVDPDKLRKQVVAVLHDPASRKVRADVEKVEPEVTTDEVAEKYPTYLVVDRNNFTLSLYESLKLSKEYTVAIGAQGFDTPTGLYSIQNKAENPVWTVPDSDWAGDLAGQSIPPGPDNPLKARWMGIYDGAGIHGTSDTGSLGSAASHGCVRMSVTDVVDLYDRVDVGTPIYIG